MTDKEKEAIRNVTKILNKKFDLNTYSHTDYKIINKAYKIYTDNDIRTVLNLIQTQQEEIEKKDKIIDEMAIYLADIDFDECCAEIPEPCLSCSWEDYEPHTNCIKEYFINKVEKEN